MKHNNISIKLYQKPSIQVQAPVELPVATSNKKIQTEQPEEPPEVLPQINVIQAEQSGCDIITMTSDLWRKLPTIGKNLDEFSKETVKMFYEDAVNSGYTI